jgi:hypothetical protein
VGTIWRLATVGDLTTLFEPAGPVDEAAVAAYLAAQRPIPSTPVQREPTVPRWYYLYAQDRRVVLKTVAMSLEMWEGPAKVIVGTFEHIGEFAATKPLVGRKGLRISLEPIEMLHGAPERFFTTGRALLAAIDWSILETRDSRKPDRNLNRKYPRDRR